MGCTVAKCRAAGLWNPQQLKHKLVISGYATNGICRPKFSVATDLFQSSATPLKIFNSSLFATAVQQGAGLVNAYQALTIAAIFSPGELALNDTVRKASSYKVNLTNIGNKAGVYKLTHSGAALATGKAPNDDQLLDMPLYSADYAVVNIEPTELTLGSGESREITLRFQAPTAADPTLLPVYSGFIYATNTVNGQIVHLSYARIIVRNTSSGVITGVQDANHRYVTDREVPTLNATVGVNIVIVLAWPTRLFIVEAVSTADDGRLGSNTSFGLVYILPSGPVLYTPNVARNVATFAGHYFPPLYPFVWNGFLSPTILRANCTALTTYRISPGQYKLRFSALKHFGDQTNPADFDVYLTPPFNLVY